jgi:hypothetical protein
LCYSDIATTAVGFEVLTAVDMKSFIFWDIALCSPLRVNRNFRGIRRACYLLHDGLLLDIFFKPEDGGNMSLQNFPSTFKGLHGVIFRKAQLFISWILLPPIPIPDNMQTFLFPAFHCIIQ